MVFLGGTLKLANNLGMLPSFHAYNPGYLIRPILIVFGCSLALLQALWFLYLYRTTDFSKATLTTGLFIAIGMHTSKILIFLFNNQKFSALYFTVKRLYDDPSQYRSTFRDDKDRSIRFYTRMTYGFLFAGCTLVVLTPLLLMAGEYWNTGAVIKNRWELPMPFAMPFVDVHTSPTYEITYLVFSVTFYPNGFFAMTVDMLFMGLCFHIYGLFQELRSRLQCANDKMKNNERVKLNDFRKNFKECIDFQNEIYGIVKDTEEVFGSVYCAVFLGTISTMCIQSFLATQNTGRLLTNIFYIATAAGELLLLGACGSMISAGNDLLKETLLESDWQQMEARVRKDFAFIVKKSNSNCRIAFLHWLNCSLESIPFVVNASFNMFTMVQHIAHRTSGDHS